MEPFTRRPRGRWEEPWWAGQTWAARLLVEALIDHAAWKRREVFEHGAVVVLEPGGCLFSLSELGEMTGATVQQLRDARESLRLAGFLDFRRAHEGARSRTLYSIRQWWRFIQAATADESDVPADQLDSGTEWEHSGDAGIAAASGGSAAGEEQSRNTVGTHSRASATRTNVQSSERIAHERRRAGVPDAREDAAGALADLPEDFTPSMPEDFDRFGGPDAWLFQQYGGDNGQGGE